MKPTIIVNTYKARYLHYVRGDLGTEYVTHENKFFEDDG